MHLKIKHRIKPCLSALFYKEVQLEYTHIFKNLIYIYDSYMLGLFLPNLFLE